MLLIDGDILVYRSAFAAQKTHYILADADTGGPFAGPFESAAERNEYIKENDVDLAECEIMTDVVVEPVENALRNAKHTITRMLEETGQPTYHVALSHGECFRHKEATMKKYKGNRDDMVKPAHYAAVREYLVKHWGAVVYEELEADDVLALMQEQGNGDDPLYGSTVIASIDKDLLQVPGKHFNWVTAFDEEKDDNGKIYVSNEVGMRRLYRQVLSGDSTDNIPGIYRVGKKTAQVLIDSVELGAPEEYLMRECLCAWEAYLHSDKPKPWDGEWSYDNEYDAYEYTSWDGIPIKANVNHIVEEVYNLVKVGGEHVKEIAAKAGIVLPDTREA
jgi:hypothetical protein